MGPNLKSGPALKPVWWCAERLDGMTGKMFAAIVSLVAIRVGCSSGTHAARSSTSVATSTTHVGAIAKTCPAGSGIHGWVRTDLRPVTQPVAVGCDFVLYDTSGGVLRVVALDAATGRTAWRIDASASGVTPGVSPTLAVAAGVVTFFEGIAAGQTAQLVGVAAGTGSVVWRSRNRGVHGLARSLP